MYKVVFSDVARPSREWSCPVCGARDANVKVFVNSGIISLGTQELARCNGCRSFFYLGGAPVIGYQNEGFESNYWLHYVQVGAGIDAMLRPLMALGSDLRGSLIDVGCGFGFVPDFWTRSGRGFGVGLESAQYGKIGRKLLAAEIHHEHLNECDAVAGKKFDIVYSSEVIEHVCNPRAFLDELVGALAPDGVMVLTTPSAGCVRPDFDEAALHAALSPGFHYFLLSKEAFDTLLEGVGLPHRTIIDTGERLVAWASRVEFPEPDMDIFDWDQYLDYLDMVSQRENPHLCGGALYRLFKDSMNTNRMGRAAAAFERLETLAKQTYGIDLVYPNIGAALSSRDFLQHLDGFPAWLGGALLFGGIYAGNLLGDLGRKLRLIKGSTHMLRHEMDTGFQFAQEAAAFLPAAVHNYRVALAEVATAEVPRGLGIEVDDPAARPTDVQIGAFRAKLCELKDVIDRHLSSIPVAGEGEPWGR